MARYFIGIMLPEEIKKSISILQGQLLKLPIKCKLVEMENLHICLSFLGQTEDSKIEEISGSMDEIANNYACFDTTINGSKAIPSENYIRVWVLEVFEENGVLKGISKEIVEKIGGDSKPPHVTLCRIKNVEDKQMVKEKIKDLKSEEKFKVCSFQLIKSELKRSGPVYTVIHESKLQPNLS